jgi:hypothetical protein
MVSTRNNKRKRDSGEDSCEEFKDSKEKSDSSGSDSEESDSVVEQSLFVYPKFDKSGGLNFDKEDEKFKELAKIIIEIFLPNLTKDIRDQFHDIIDNFSQDPPEKELIKEFIKIINVFGDYFEQIAPKIIKEFSKDNTIFLKLLKKESPTLYKKYHQGLSKYRTFLNLIHVEVCKSEKTMKKLNNVR